MVKERKTDGQCHQLEQIFFERYLGISIVWKKYLDISTDTFFYNYSIDIDTKKKRKKKKNRKIGKNRENKKRKKYMRKCKILHFI